MSAYKRWGARTPLFPANGASTRSSKGLPLLVVLAVVLTACGSDKNSSATTTVAVAPTVAATTPVPSTATPLASSTGTTSGGTTGDSLVVGTDLPLDGDFAADVNLAVALLLEQERGKAGKFDITIKEYDSSTVDLCKTNASDHLANVDEIAIMGTYSSGCAKFQLPELSSDPAGPMLMISPYNTNRGLTKAGDPDEPDKYYPTGTRNYGRLIATEDLQGKAEAEFAAKELGVTKCVVLDDAESYGVGVAQGFEDAAKGAGIAIVANSQWDSAQSDYTTLFEGFKALNPDCFFLGGTGDVNGEQLIRDKVAVFGPNTSAVKLFAPDGFIGYESIQQLPESEGMYLSYIGLPLSELVKAGGAAADFVDAFKTKNGHEPDATALYGAAAMQFVLMAIEGSDGTRKDVVREAFSGIIVPANESLIGRELSIDEHGDIPIGDASIEILTGGVETFVKAWPV